ncbi:hypothetical protein DIURU_000800 [Diutina rugosa]|uniref:Uncharacterized protein n=1 Tax=Diutina rugosa TaxID=5481 RepID=A0A642UX30_DIURU|nr:uncharacterized protein DIURU_000800 [Diutina rugosa]KAA8907116.1 hypothetical protein DIURU_000800 [Diutina rugosa]
MFRRSKSQPVATRPAPPPPYVLSKAAAPEKTTKSSVSICWLCQIILTTRLVNESYVELECGALVHEACFNLRMEHQQRKLAKDDSELNPAQIRKRLFPQCECGCDKTAIPKDEALIDGYMTRALEMQTPSPKYNRNLAPFARTFSISNSEISVETPLTSVTTSSISKRVSSLRGSKLPPPPILSRVSSSESLLEASIAPSIVSVDPSTPQLQQYENVTYDNLLTAFLTHIMVRFPSLSMGNLFQMGKLRLADMLSVSFDEGVSWRPSLVYLFEHTLVLEWQPQIPMVIKVATYRARGLNFPGAVELSSFEEGEEKTRVWFKSDPISVVEKWQCAFLEPGLEFPTQFLSSTINLDLPPSTPSFSEASVASDDSTSVASSLKLPQNSLQSPFSLELPLRQQSLTGNDTEITSPLQLKRVSKQLETINEIDSTPRSSAPATIPKSLDPKGHQWQPGKETQPFSANITLVNDSDYSDDDDDVDSDQELISASVAARIEKEWTSLIAEVDEAIMSG